MNVAVAAPDRAIPFLQARGVKKHFGGAQALRGVDFTLYGGEVHALLGENGAGKTTLMNILSGVHTPDDGEITIAGQAVRFKDPREAQAAGIACNDVRFQKFVGVANAIDATAEGGRLMVRARRSRDWKTPERTGVRFVIADTGAGMEPAVRARAFEPFFTTKEVMGTGLGLWVSHEIIVKSHGIVHLRSRTPRNGRAGGTVFQIFLPDDPIGEQST